MVDETNQGDLEGELDGAVILGVADHSGVDAAPGKVERFTGWRTPRQLWEPLDQAVGGFAVDAAADADNHLVADWFGPGSPIGEDALSIDEWPNPAWCNPPYGRGLTKWLDKFNQQASLGVNIIALLPAYVERKWWHEKIIIPGADVIFLVGRVAFEKPGSLVRSQPRDPSALVIYGPTSAGRVGWLDWRKREVASDESGDRDSQS